MVVATATGCATWTRPGFIGPSSSETSPSANNPGLPEARIPDSAAVLDFATLAIPDPKAANAGTLPWETLDESAIPLEIRRRLASNGLRAGRIVAFDASQIVQREETAEQKLLQETSLESDFDRRHRRLTCREGQSRILAARRPITGTVPVLVRNESDVVGRSVVNPQFNLVLRTYLLDDGRVLASLLPEIHHGDIKQNVVSTDSSAFRFDFSRETWSLGQLAIEVPLSEGQAIVIMPTDEPFGLGRQMLVGQKADQTEERTAVVIHLNRRPRTVAGGGS
jgi:hypothetical protein